MKILSLFALISTVLFSGHLVAEEIAGKTMLARGSVLAGPDPEVDPRSLKRRSPIYDSDVVVTGSAAKAQLRMTDGGMIALKENSELMIASYQYSETNQDGEVVLELIKGGLRSVTGKIKSEEGNYKLNTPVGSIGIRGTHYEVELVGGDMFIAVWDGAIDIAIDTGERAGSTVSFGEGEDYSYATIDTQGNVTELLEPPANFSSGMSSETTEETEEDSAGQEAQQEEQQEEQQEDEQQGASDSESEESTSESSEESEPESNNESTNDEQQSEQPLDSGDSRDDSGAEPQNAPQGDESPQSAPPEIVPEVSTEPEIPEPIINPDLDELDDIGAEQPLDELLMNRSGIGTYSQFTSPLPSVTSTAGTVRDFEVSIAIDFDTLGVTAGNLSFSDDQGQWNATFSGNITASGDFNLAISEANHGNNFADGTINASFLDGLESILGNFELFEIADPSVNSEGNFRIKE